MPIIALSADDFDQGLEIARHTAESLDYRFLGRELLQEIAEQHGPSPEELAKALDEPPGFLSLGARRRRRLITRIQALSLERLLPGKTVCYGLGAHLYLDGVSHALRVRILSDPQERVERLARSAGIPPERARRQVQSQDEVRRRWSLEFFQMDETDPAGYDMVLSLATLDTAKAVEIICDTAGYRKFQPMTYSRKCLMDKVLEARVRLKLMDRFPDVKVQAADGTVVVQVPSIKPDQRRKQKEVRRLAGQVPGVDYVEVHVVNAFFEKAGGGR